MMTPTRSTKIGLIGDHDPTIVAHQAIPLALARAGAAAGTDVILTWVPTERVDSPATVADFDGLWCVPGSPYRDMDGALRAIGHARQAPLPFLGTCAGFQLALVEYARSVLGWLDADHAETAGESGRAVIAPLSCAMVEVTGAILLRDGSRMAAIFGAREVREGYHCRYGLNEAFREALLGGPLRITGEDENGDVRAIELEGHPFFMATLFQPERGALVGRTPPLVEAFVRAARTHGQSCA